MIAFEELVSALDRWRIRNGLAVVTGDLPLAVASTASTPRSTNSMPGHRPAPIGESSDVLSLGDADVLEEDELYSNEGDDFAMSFGGAGNPVGAVSGSIGGRESTVSGPAPTGAPPAMPAYDPYAEPPGHDQAYAAPEDDDLDAYPATPPPAALAGSGPIPQQELYDDPAYDPPGGDTLDRPVTDGYASPGPDTLDADGDVIDEATVVGDDHRKR